MKHRFTEHRMAAPVQYATMDSALALSAVCSANEIDHLLKNQPSPLKYTKRLSSALKQQVDRGAPAARHDFASFMPIGRAVIAIHRSSNAVTLTDAYSEVQKLIEVIEKISSEPGIPPADLAEELKQVKEFCLALSRSVGHGSAREEQKFRDRTLLFSS